MIRIIMVATFLFIGQLHASEPILPVQPPQGLDMEKVKLGRMLFHEPRLSADGSISCASCHHLESGGVDHLATSLGIDEQEGDLNAPTVFNSALNFRQLWNGRAKTLEEQVSFPIQDSKEMANTWDHVLQFLRQDKVYASLFHALYDDGVTVANVSHAIAEFERSLTLPGSRFDQYLQGDASALTEDEKKGYGLFKDYGCVACHQGEAVGANMFQKFGVFGNYFDTRKQPMTQADLGRFLVTGDPEDKHVFKVPSLRMVIQTAPYFHDGSVPTLDEAIRMMGKYQLGRDIPEKDIALIKAFLATLAGVYKEAKQ